MEETERETGKKMGVYVNGSLKLQTRNRAKAEDASVKWMRQGHDVWLTPIGSFITT